MKFFDRTDEIARLREIRERASTTSQFTVITGRRRVGKTELLKHAYADDDFIYLFVSRKAESVLVTSFIEEVNRLYPEAISVEISTLGGFFRELMKLAERQPLTVFIDEFQEFFRINPSVYGDLQGLWDRFHDKVRLNLVVCGSINSLMTKIFQNRKEPLYGRQTALLRIEPFTTTTLKEILSHYAPEYTSDDLLALYAFTGGVAKYVASLMDARAYTPEQMVKCIISPDSLFLDEGKMLLSDEFGKDYAVYFSILSAIARGATTRNEIEQDVGRAVGGHLTRLENDYHLIAKQEPFRARSSKVVRYLIDDRFYVFWFRFIFKYDYMLQIGSYDMLRKVVLRDYPVFSGKALERYFRQKFAEGGAWTRIGSWWDRRGENEIDLVAENELDRTLAVYEVKRDSKRYRGEELDAKIKTFLSVLGRQASLPVARGVLSLDDM